MVTSVPGTLHESFTVKEASASGTTMGAAATIPAHTMAIRIAFVWFIGGVPPGFLRKRGCRTGRA